MTRSHPARRRDNAPIRKRRPVTTVPDLLFALAATGWGMAATFVVATLIDRDLTAGTEGVVLARIFAGALAVAGLALFLLGVVLLRDERGRGDHYRVPLLLGLAIGVIEAILFLAGGGALLYLPLILLVLALRPVRAAVARLAGGGR